MAFESLQTLHSLHRNLKLEVELLLLCSHFYCQLASCLHAIGGRQRGAFDHPFGCVVSDDVAETNSREHSEDEIEAQRLGPI